MVNNDHESSEAFYNGPDGAKIPSKLFLWSWRTNGGMVALGILLTYALGTMVAWVSSAGAIIFGIGFSVFVAVYVLVIYPSLFTEKPKMTSQAAVSFLNGFAGGIIFGPLWCASLTKGKRGVSQYVLLVFLAIGLIGVIAQLAPSFTGVSQIGVRAQPTPPFTKTELVQLASTEDELTPKAREVLKSEMILIDENDYSDILKRIQFGSLWYSTNGPGGYYGQGWYVEDVDYETSAQLLAIALCQMAGSDAELDKAVETLSSSVPEESRGWRGNTTSFNLFLQDTTSSEPEPADKSQVYVLRNYGDIPLELDGKTWYVHWQYWSIGDYSRFTGGLSELAKVEISDSKYGGNYRPDEIRNRLFRDA